MFQHLIRSIRWCVIYFAIVRILFEWLCVKIQGKWACTRKKYTRSGAKELIQKKILRFTWGLHLAIDNLDVTRSFCGRLHILDRKDERAKREIIQDHRGFDDGANVTNVNLRVISVVDRREYSDAVDGDSDSDLWSK